MDVKHHDQATRALGEALYALFAAIAHLEAGDLGSANNALAMLRVNLCAAIHAIERGERS